MVDAGVAPMISGANGEVDGGLHGEGSPGKWLASLFASRRDAKRRLEGFGAPAS
jgi:hypothetical protein